LVLPLRTSSWTKSEPVRFFVMHKPKDAAQP